MATPNPLLSHLLLLLFFSLPLTAFSANPFAAKAAALRYWDRKTPAQRPHPSFLLSKLSPLSALDSATYSSLIASDPSSLTPRLPAFCSAARLLCSSSFSNSLASHHGDSHFATYDNINFTNYGTLANRGSDSFKNYSFKQRIPVDSFRRYSRGSFGREENFKLYSLDGTIITDNFTSYATNSTAINGDFATYGRSSQVTELTFSNYNTNSTANSQDFTSYSDDIKQGTQTFTGYDKGGTASESTFTSYSKNSDLVISGFTNYGENTDSPLDNFTNYGDNPGISHQSFSSYAANSVHPDALFTNYRFVGDVGDVGDDTFQSYGKGSELPIVSFVRYGPDFLVGVDKFKSYGEGAEQASVDFMTYNGSRNQFSSYFKAGASFLDYHNTTSPSAAAAADTTSGKTVTRWVEPGKFFRESSLKEGTVMPMPDIRDKMPERSFLPRSIAGKLPFNATELTRIFNSPPATALGRAIGDTISECRRAPSRGETKQCPTSAEDMIDFAVSVLGSSAVPRSTESASGSGGDILIGKITGINGGNVTRSVSCHQSLFPYLVYYCHSVPMVRVYEAEILAVQTKEKINHGVAICHMDTSDWGPEHGAFVALGARPGQIEVCHWIFQGDMTWVAAD